MPRVSLRLTLRELHPSDPACPAPFARRCSTPASHGTHTATADICGDTTEECLTKARRGPPRAQAGTDGLSIPIFINYRPRLQRVAPRPQAPRTGAGPTLLEGRKGPSFSSACVSRPPCGHRRSGSARSLGSWARRGEASEQLPPAPEPGRGAGADPAEAPGTPAQGVGRPGPLDTQLRTEATWKPPGSRPGRLGQGSSPRLCGATLRCRTLVLRLCDLKRRA